MIVDAAMARRLAAVRLLVCDVDGTLTDGAMWYGPDGEALKRFHTRDGHGIGMLRRAGVEVALMTAEDSPIVSARAAKLGITEVILGCADKAEAMHALLRSSGVVAGEAAMIGDDLGDLAAFSVVGVRVAVADAVDDVRRAADLVCELRGGHGAVRELAEAMLAARAQAAQEAQAAGD